MKYILNTLVAVLVAMPALAAPVIDESLPLPASGSVTIDDAHGNFTIHGWDKNEITVKGQLADQAKQYVFEKEGDNVQFRVIYKDLSRAWFGDRDDGNSTLTVNMPGTARLQVRSVTGDVALADLTGDVSVTTVDGSISGKVLAAQIRLNTINGDISTEKLRGKVTIETVNGDISDRQSTGEISYQTVHGDVQAETDSSRVSLQLVNGDADLQLGAIDDLAVELVNGDIRAYLALQKNGEVTVATVNGDVSLYFNGNVSAEFAINTHIGGDIENRLTDDHAAETKMRMGQRLRFKTGTGAGRVEVSTVSGDIKIGRR